MKTSGNSQLQNLHNSINTLYDDAADFINSRKIYSLSGGMKTVSSITSINNTHHIALYNYNNSFCFHISVIQKLHTSTTLNHIFTQLFMKRLNNFIKTCAFNNKYVRSTGELIDLFSINAFKEILKEFCSNDPLQHTLLTQFLYPLYIYSIWDFLRNTTLHDYISAQQLFDRGIPPLFTNFSMSISDYDLYNRMKEYFDAFVPTMVKPTARNGYFPQQLLIYFMLPCVYILTRAFEKSIDKTSDESEYILFKNIISELHIDSINFKRIEYVIADDISGENSYLDDVNYRNVMYGMYKQMLKRIPEKIDMGPFVAATLEVFPNKDRTGGHAITLLKVKLDEMNCREKQIERVLDDGSRMSVRSRECSNIDYYIIDDHNSIESLENYYESRKDRLFEIVIREIDPIHVANINAILKSKCSSEASLSNRVTKYVLNFEHKYLKGADMIASRATEIIEDTREKVLERIDETFQKFIGGENGESKNDRSIFDKYTWIGFAIGMLVGIVLTCLIIRNITIRIEGAEKNMTEEKNNSVEGFMIRGVKKLFHK